MRAILLLFLCGCGLTKGIDGINAQMGAMGESVKSMSDYLKETKESLKFTRTAIGKQGAALALKELLAPENTFFVNPGSSTPTSMIPSGKALAEMLTAEEVLGLFTLFATEINEAQIDPVTPENKEKSDKVKWVKLVAMQIVSAFLPDETIAEIIKQKEGKYANSVAIVFVLRYHFIADYLLELGLLQKQKINQAEYREGTEAIAKLRSIEVLPESKNYSFETRSFFDDAGLGLNQVIKIDFKADEYQKRLDQIQK